VHVLVQELVVVVVRVIGSIFIINNSISIVLFSFIPLTVISSVKVRRA